MGSEFKIFGCTVVGIDGGAQIEASHGCDGNIHVDCINKVWVDGNGTVTFAEPIGEVERGFCPNRSSDGGCCCEMEQTGFFSYSY